MKTKQRQRKNPVAKELRRSFYHKNKIMYGAALLGVCVDSILVVLLAFLLQKIMDVATGTANDSIPSIIIMCLIYAGCMLVNSLILRETRNRFIKRAMLQYKETAFHKISGKNISSFAEESTSRYISVLTNDAASIETNYLQNILSLITQCLWFIGSLVMMFVYSWSLTLVVIGLSLIPVILSLAVSGKVVKEETNVSNRNEGFVAMVKDLLSGFPVIKSFKAEKEAEGLFFNNNKDLEQVKCRRRRAEEMISIITGLCGGMVQIGVFIYGAYLCLNGQITAGVVIAFVQLMNFVLSPIQTVPKLIAGRKAAKALINKLADAVEEHNYEGGTEVVESLRDGIRISDLHFGYTEEEKVLKGIDLHFEEGKSYAIVGSSGSGKSTLLNLLLGSYSNYEGSIKVGGVELRDITSDNLYDIMSIIQQNVFVFDSTITENICMFKQFPKEAVQSAIDRAGLTELIAAKGEDYRCGENGAALSGGEKQRISIARCLLRNTSVLLMDEATAALDTVTSHMVTEAILDVEGLTRIIVTHKLERDLMERYDQIIVIKKGNIVECGNFSELMNKKEYFYSLVNAEE